MGDYKVRKSVGGTFFLSDGDDLMCKQCNVQLQGDLCLTRSSTTVLNWCTL